MEPVIRATNIQKRYGDVTAVDDVSVTVGRGDGGGVRVDEREIRPRQAGEAGKHLRTLRRIGEDQEEQYQPREPVGLAEIEPTPAGDGLGRQRRGGVRRPVGTWPALYHWPRPTAPWTSNCSSTACARS